MEIQIEKSASIHTQNYLKKTISMSGNDTTYDSKNSNSSSSNSNKIDIEVSN